MSKKISEFNWDDIDGVQYGGEVRAEIDCVSLSLHKPSCINLPGINIEMWPQDAERLADDLKRAAKVHRELRK